jgi:hypothetical protein
MKTEFTTFRVIEGKEDLAEEWVETLKTRQEECVETLTREKMVFESVFKFHKEGRLYLSWFSLQEEGHKEVDTSGHKIDKVHLEYWDECIDRSFKPEDHIHVVSFIPKELKGIMEAMYTS